MKITIEGHPGEGKTTIALLIAGALKHAGIDFVVDDPDVDDIDEALANPLLPMWVQALSNKDDHGIMIETRQIRFKR